MIALPSRFVSIIAIVAVWTSSCVPAARCEDECLSQGSAAELDAPTTGVSSSTGSLYRKGRSLQETLLSTRDRYASWLAAQPDVRQAVTCSPWWITPPMPAHRAESIVNPRAGIDTAALLAGGDPLWTRSADVMDGQVVSVPGGPPESVIYLARTIDAARVVSLTVGAGGGERLEMWLNGQKIAAAETGLAYDRYGCWDGYEGSRVDQVVVDLPLTEGANTLVVQLALGGEPSFYFSLTPDPVPGFWSRLREDFSPEQNPLLEWMPADWFKTAGWFVAGGIEFEQRLIARLAAQCGDQADSIHGECRRLREVQVDQPDAGWLDLCVHAAVVATVQRDLKQLRAAVDALGQTHSDDAYPAGMLARELDSYEHRVARRAAQRLEPAAEETRALLAELPAMRRRMLVELNPLLRDAEIVFVKRYTYNSKHYYDDFQHISQWGGNLCVLSLRDGRVREVAPQLAGGIFDRYDLSFDGHRIAFGYRRPLPEGFRIWEIGVDGSGLRQVTAVPEDEEQRVARYGRTSYGDGFYGLLGYRFWTDDVHPCYLPDGGLCFASSRSEHGVLCTPAHYLACTNLYRVDGDRVRQLSHGALSEFTPTIMEDGRILYNRWEYVYKGIAAVQPLWTMRPDGAGSEEYYGDNIANPGVFWQARQIPGRPGMAVCIGCGHEPLGVGKVLLLDVSKDKRTREPITNLTPDVDIRSLRGIYHLRNGVWREDYYGPLYADPYPLSDRFFLVSCNPDRRYNDRSAYGIHLLDAFGNRVPIYHDPEISSWQPMLLRSRAVPPVIPTVQSESPQGDSHATVFLRDVYRGLEDVERGAVKYVRVMEQVAKPWSAEVDPVRDEDRSADGFGGHLAVSWNAHIWVAVLHGVVPVHDDGSACFHVPAGRNLFFQALDEDFMEVQRMRTFVNFVPGESRSCIGCHEHRTQAPDAGQVLAFGPPPAELAAQPGELAPRPLDYVSDVQPILDRHCVRCHDGLDSQAPPDLRGELTTLFNRSYESILRGGWVNTIQEWDGIDYSMMHADAAAPYSYGSHRSRLVEIMRQGHHDVALDREEFVRLVTWIDSGAPYYGSYFGRRHLMYQGQPDFRVVPTLSSAQGVSPPEVAIPEHAPIPARLLVCWPLHVVNAAAGDASSALSGGHAQDGTMRPEGPEDSSLRRFDGSNYIESAGLGTHQTLSIAMWVKPHSLGHTWNPLLFGNDIRPGTVHFSLLSDGTPNVAIHSGGEHWTHRRAHSGAVTGQWHHVALVCDARLGGTVQFYVDGQLSGESRWTLGLGLDLDRFRIGAWNRWEGSPANNFHGELREVRVYSGMLTPQQVATLASGKQ